MERFFIVFIFNHQIEFVSRRTVQLGIIEIISLRAQRTVMFTNRLDSRLWLTKVKSLHGIDGNSTRHRRANLTQLCAQSTMWHKTITVCCALRPSRSPSIACQAQQKKEGENGRFICAHERSKQWRRHLWMFLLLLPSITRAVFVYYVLFLSSMTRHAGTCNFSSSSGIILSLTKTATTTSFEQSFNPSQSPCRCIRKWHVARNRLLFIVPHVVR